MSILKSYKISFSDIAFPQLFALITLEYKLQSTANVLSHLYPITPARCFHLESFCSEKLTFMTIVYVSKIIFGNFPKHLRSQPAKMEIKYNY